MIVEERIPIASLTTLRAGGEARFVVTCTSIEDVRRALSFSAEHSLPWYVLGEGSNILAEDGGFGGVILLMRMQGMRIDREESRALLTASAGESWDAVVREAAKNSLWGIENLAGIPGTIGAAPVQNIGAYGVELADTLLYLDALHVPSGKVMRITRDECEFGYRESRFKHGHHYLILSVTLELQLEGTPALSYTDLARLKEQGTDLSSPLVIGDAVRAIRARKFPDLSVYGTAGSFFKNPVISMERYAVLSKDYPELPKYPAEGGVKVPLAFILDRIVKLKGFTNGRARLFEAQPLVLVLEKGGTAEEVEELARVVEEKVYFATGIRIEREVQILR